MFQILEKGFKISNFYLLYGFDWYMTSIPCNRKSHLGGSEEFKMYATSKNKFNQISDNVYISVLKMYDEEYLFLEHNEKLQQTEIDKLTTIEQDFLSSQEKFLKLYKI